MNRAKNDRGVVESKRRNGGSARRGVRLLISSRFQLRPCTKCEDVFPPYFPQPIVLEPVGSIRSPKAHQTFQGHAGRVVVLSVWTLDVWRCSYSILADKLGKLADADLFRSYLREFVSVSLTGEVCAQSMFFLFLKSIDRKEAMVQ